MAENGKPTVSVIYPEHYEQVAVALGRAFVNDPTFKPLIPDVTDPAARILRLTDLFRAILAIERRHGQPTFGVFDDGRVVGAAVTEGTGHPSVIGFLMTGSAQLPRLVSALGWGGVGRALNMFNILAQNHPKEPHLYLQLLGVDPAYQGKHYGGALLERLRLETALRPDLTGVYLETATEENVAYYSARGYEILGELRPLGVRMWRMFQPKR